jgi:hypothetical protein
MSRSRTYLVVVGVHFLLSVGLLVAVRFLFGMAFFSRVAPWTQMLRIASRLATLFAAPIALALWESILGNGWVALDNPAVYGLLAANSAFCGSMLAAVWLWWRRRRRGVGA